MNNSGITPCEYKVLVRPKKVEEKTQGGVLLPDDTQEREQFGQIEGELVAVSPGAFTFNYEGCPDEAKPKVGQTVLFSRYNGNELKGRDGEKYWIMPDKAIVGVMA